MQIKANSVAEYLEALPEERQLVIQKLRDVIKKSTPKGFEERLSYGTIGYVVPHEMYPSGYHCDPKLPLPFVNLASQKNFIALYHMGLYANPELMAWFTEAYPKHAKTKLDMGKSCIRFKKMDDIPYDLIAELMGKISPEKYIEEYERHLKK